VDEGTPAAARRDELLRALKQLGVRTPKPFQRSLMLRQIESANRLNAVGDLWNPQASVSTLKCVGPFRRRQTG
jgi:hypothetical protein